MGAQRLPLTRRQHEILQFIESYIAANGISPTLEEIAADSGVNKVTVFGHVAELERKGVLVRAARGTSRSLQIAAQSTSPETIQVIGTIAAGCPIEAVEQAEHLTLTDLVPRGGDCYALRVEGSSMIDDGIRSGDFVLVERRESARNGETIVAVLPEGGVTLKRFYKEANGIRLQPANDSMPAILVPSVEIRGVVVGLIRRM